MARVEFNPKKDGNVFKWILSAAENLRKERREERERIKQELAEGDFRYDHNRNKLV